MGEPLRNIVDEVNMYLCYLETLKEEIENHPEDIFREYHYKKVSVQMSLRSEKGTVFIIHGHDELNLLRLEKLLKDKFNLQVIVLKDKLGKGRTLIEKFEQEAQSATFAFALFTPDDFIEIAKNKEKEKYAQARPNVIFELVWFYGRLGRDKVCILFKQSTKIHSDLDGITRIEFRENIEEKVKDIENELSGANMF